MDRVLEASWQLVFMKFKGTAYPAMRSNGKDPNLEKAFLSFIPSILPDSFSADSINKPAIIHWISNAMLTKP